MSDKPRKQCPYCDQTFTDYSNRRRHVRKQHPETLETAPREPDAVAAPTIVITHNRFTGSPDPAFYSDNIMPGSYGPVGVERITAGDVETDDVIIWQGEKRSVADAWPENSAGRVTLWFSQAYRIDIPARTPVQRIEK